MIRTITSTNPQGESFTLDLRNPWILGLAITEASGLGPVKADINMTDMITRDGSMYNSANANYRNIVLKYRYLNEISDSRKMSYRMFPLKEKVTLRITTDDNVYLTDGYVESNEPNIFSPESGGQVSILCPQPYLKSGSMFETVVSGIANEFTFPFSNESLDSDLIEFGVVRANNGVNTFYDGDKPCGINITIKASGTVENLMFYNASKRTQLTIDTTKLTTITGDPIIAGDLIEINTSKGEKSVSLFRDGEYTNIINALTSDSDWLELQLGDNVFAYTADTGLNVVSITVKYRKLYEGV